MASSLWRLTKPFVIVNGVCFSLSFVSIGIGMFAGVLITEKGSGDLTPLDPVMTAALFSRNMLKSLRFINLILLFHLLFRNRNLITLFLDTLK